VTDPYVASPHWHWLITAYFYLGGIAAGAYAVFTLAGLLGGEAERRAARGGAYLAFPLVCLCGLLLVVDLGRPERFWHMMIASETYRPMLKWWSPMSIGSWGLSAFGAFSFASFLGALAEDGWPGLGRFSTLAARLRGGWFGRLFGGFGLASAFFLGAYTGVLLSATNQPVWAETTWISPLFLASSASTGVAAVILFAAGRLRDVEEGAVARLEWLDGYAIVLELILLAAFAVSLGPLAARGFSRWPGVLIPAVVVPMGVVLPLAARSVPRRWSPYAAAASVLVGGLALRVAVVGMPEAFVGR
jgi:formate-dependent nitrite reductase membrane component NrfD